MNYKKEEPILKVFLFETALKSDCFEKTTRTLLTC